MDALDVRRTFDLGGGKTGQLHSLPALEEQGLGAGRNGWGAGRGALDAASALGRK